ncbi:hypothetical protein ACQE98_13335 [Ornithinimicrobium sp. W1679]|uniref:hypothetical protein n=1 Tax=Ornithinimicrobium sp. W1679 TaxID=3418770 RepID=UPI003CEA35D1
MKDVLDDLASMPFQPSNPFDTFSTIAEFWKQGVAGYARGDGPLGGWIPDESRVTVPGYALPIIEKARAKKSPWLEKMVSDREDDGLGKDRLSGVSHRIPNSERLVVAPNVERSRAWRELQRKSGEVESWEQVGEEHFIGYTKSRARESEEGVATHVVIHPDVEDLPELVSVIDTSQFGT